MENPSSSSGLRTCPSCGSPVEPGHKFCEICGTKMEELPVCRNCGAQFIAPVKFCEVCGAPVTPQGRPRVVESAPPEPESEPGPEPEFMEPLPEPEGKEPEPVPVTPVSKPSRTVIEKIPPPPPEPEPVPAEIPGKKPVNKALVAGAVVVLLIVIAGAFFVGLPMLKGSSTGSSAPAVPVTPAVTPPPVATNVPVETAVPTTLPPTPDNSMVPLPIDQMPHNQEVFFDVQKDQVNAKITVLFQRGPGETLISSADVKVTHPDGTVVTGRIKPSQGNELTLDGSKGTDRVEVIAHMYSGLSYRVKDELRTFKVM